MKYNLQSSSDADACLAPAKFTESPPSDWHWYWRGRQATRKRLGGAKSLENEEKGGKKSQVIERTPWKELAGPLTEQKKGKTQVNLLQASDLTDVNESSICK